MSDYPKDNFFGITDGIDRKTHVDFDVGNVTLTDAHLRREYVSHREFSNEDLSFKAAAREVDFANPFSVKIKNIIISWLRDFSVLHQYRID